MMKVEPAPAKMSIDSYVASRRDNGSPLDDVEMQALKALDKDGDGTLDVNEMFKASLALRSESQKVTVLGWGLGVAVVFAFLMLGAMLGVALWANELAKESYVADGAMADKDGNVLAISQKLESLPIMQYASLDIAALATVTSLVFAAGNTDVAMNIARVEKTQAGVATFTSSNNDKLVISKSDVVYVAAGSATSITVFPAPASASRRLLSGEGGYGSMTCTNCRVKATCDDFIMNGDETGVDCGGSSCSACAPVQPAVNLGTAADFTLLSKSGITTTGVTKITGDIGTSPITQAAMTGFALAMDASTEFYTTPIVDGKAYGVLHSAVKLGAAVLDMQAAYTDAAGRVPASTFDTGTGTLVGNIDNFVFTAGVYKWSSPVVFANGVTFTGSSTDVFIMQVAQTLIVGSGATVTLKGGVKASNIFWVVAGYVQITTGATMHGIILGATYIAYQAGSKHDGRALAQTAITIIAATIGAPSKAVVVVPLPPAPQPTPEEEFHEGEEEFHEGDFN